MKKVFILLTAVLLVGSLQAQKNKGEKKVEIITSDKPGWQKIGQMTASFKKERDVMVIVGEDRFAALKIKATEADINITDMEVHYENGTSQEIKVRQEIKKGTESRLIDLNGGERKLKKITFVYKTIANGGNEKAELEVWGLKTNAGKK